MAGGIGADCCAKVRPGVSDCGMLGSKEALNGNNLISKFQFFLFFSFLFFNSFGRLCCCSCDEDPPPILSSECVATEEEVPIWEPEYCSFDFIKCIEHLDVVTMYQKRKQS